MKLITLLKNQSTEIPEATGNLAKLFCSDPCAERMLRAGRYCQLLRANEGSWEDDAISAAMEALERDMAFVPSGSTEIHTIASSDVTLEGDSSPRSTVSFEDSFHIDRFAVTNDQFEKFVAADGYRQEEFWPEEILPLILQFIDQTSHPGPAFWKDGRPPHELRDHPVVGISWYEASAFAIWAGKQLPSSGQWQRAGTWWRPKVRYPWGDAFELDRANTACSTRNQTSRSVDYAAGATPNGIYQLSGNVWEWVYASVGAVEIDGTRAPLLEPLGEVRGGAFDTYLSSQATCYFRSGRDLLSRNANIGFRCCIASVDIQQWVETSSSTESTS